MGDLRVGEPGSPSPGNIEDEEGIPLISSSSVTTRPFAVISLLRMIRRWGKRPRAVWTCCRTAVFLRCVRIVGAQYRMRQTYSLMPDRISRMML